MFCKACGSEIAANAVVCPKCGAAAGMGGNQAAPGAGYVPQRPQYAPPTYQGANQSSVVSVGQWIGTMIITAIPLVGFIMLLVWAFSGDTNPSKKNYARAALILGIIGGILFAIISIIAAIVGASIFSLSNSYYYY